MKAEPFIQGLKFGEGLRWHQGRFWYSDFYNHRISSAAPDGTVWGPMHWGHTTSSDLIHWQQQPIALYPDSLGYIFSGSAVADSRCASAPLRHSLR